MAARLDRLKTRTDPAHSTSPPDPPVIPANAVYSLPQAARLLGLKANCLPREVRLRRLRVAKRAGRYFVLGSWLLEWLAGGERTQAVAPVGRGDGTAA